MDQDYESQSEVTVPLWWPNL